MRVHHDSSQQHDLDPMFLLPLLSLISQCNSGAIQHDSNNIDATLANQELVFINFYAADWCSFSKMLVLSKLRLGADKISAELAGQSVMVGKVDCDKHGDLGTRFHITEYPTIKFVKN